MKASGTYRDLFSSVANFCFCRSFKMVTQFLVHDYPGSVLGPEDDDDRIFRAWLL